MIRYEIIANSKLRMFAKMCANLSSEEIFELFEDHLSQEIREAVYCVAGSESPEPFREACNKIGETFYVQSLLCY